MDSTIKLMIQQAHDALKRAYAPYSQFQVAACLLAADGSMHTGVNVENASYGLTICAETSAICNMVSSTGQQTIKSMVILSGRNELCAPCGACRQRIIELSTPTTTIYLCDKDTVLKSVSIQELLPLAFDFKPRQEP